LTKFLLDKELIFIKDKENNTIGFIPLNNEQLQDKQIKKLEAALYELLNIIRYNPNNTITLSPNNVFIEFEDNDKTCIKKIELIEYGSVWRKIEIYNKLTTFNQYLKFAADKLNQYRTNNIF
jgi:uncharacterized protein (UPF0297 family)